MRFALGMDNREIARASTRTDRRRGVVAPYVRQLEDIVQARHERERAGWLIRPSRTWSAAAFALLRRSTADHLQRRVEQTLDNIVERAADELESWEIRGVKDPRNWPRARSARRRSSSAPARRRSVCCAPSTGATSAARRQGRRDLAARTMRDAPASVEGLRGIAPRPLIQNHGRAGTRAMDVRTR